MTTRTTLACLVIMTLIAACTTIGVRAAAPAQEAVSVIQPASGSNCKGVVHFTQDANRIRVVADIEGLAPNSKHGFHIHEYGDCSAADASSAGSHYDPAGTKHHGMPSETTSHAGDMGNIEADANGKVHYELTLGGTSIDGSQASVLGRGVIVHANPDDFGQPVGNAGARIGCGVIGVAKPAK